MRRGVLEYGRFAGSFERRVIVAAMLASLSLLLFVLVRARSERALLEFASDLRDFASAADRYAADTGQELDGAAVNALALDWDRYVETRKWARPTPIGGSWELSRDAEGIGVGLGVRFGAGGEDRPDREAMARIDGLLDDGDLDQGLFRRIDDDRYCYVLVPGRAGLSTGLSAP